MSCVHQVSKIGWQCMRSSGKQTIHAIIKTQLALFIFAPKPPRRSRIIHSQSSWKITPKAKVATPGRGGGPQQQPMMLLLLPTISKWEADGQGQNLAYGYNWNLSVIWAPSEIRIKTSQEAPSEVLTCANSFQKGCGENFIFAYIIWNPHESAIHVFHLSVSSCKFCIIHHPPSAIIISNH